MPRGGCDEVISWLGRQYGYLPPTPAKKPRRGS